MKPKLKYHVVPLVHLIRPRRWNWCLAVDIAFEGEDQNLDCAGQAFRV